MTLKDTAIANKAKQEMILWRKTFLIAQNMGSDTYSATILANLSIEAFNKAFDEYGNAI